MRLVSFWNRRHDKSRVSQQRRRASRPSRRRLTSGLVGEQLEDRRLLTVLTPNTFADSNTSFNPAAYVLGSSATLTLRDAVIEANWLYNTNSATLGNANTISLKAGTYTLSIPNASTGYETASATGDLNINSNLTIQGVGAATVPLTTINQTAADRVFAVNTPGLTENFCDLAIAGGKAVNDPSGADTFAEGGGIWASGDTLALSTVTFRGDCAVGAAVSGAEDANYAIGGGMYDSSGTLGLTNVTFQSNSAVGGAGSATAGYGNGGSALGGGLYTLEVAVTLGAASSISIVTFNGNQAVGGAVGAPASPSAFRSGAGAYGGQANGGGMFADDGTTLIEASRSLNVADFLLNKAVGSTGGNGGSGNSSGGTGGQGGNGLGGGLFAEGASITLRGGYFMANVAQGGVGGAGGNGIGVGGAGGLGGSGLGGALTQFFDATSLTQVIISLNKAQGGAGGAGGSGTSSNATGGEGGSGGFAYGGGIVETDTTLNITGGFVTGNQALAGNGAVGGGPGTTGLGGPGGWAQGGGINGYAGSVNLAGPSVSANLAQGGNGAKGANNSSSSNANTQYSQPGGGGFAQGGGIYLEDVADTAANSFSLLGNRVLGGNGGSGLGSADIAGIGGQADGGGLFTYDSTFSVSSSYLDANMAQGGYGGLSGAHGTGAGGAAKGGSVYLDGGGLTLTNSWVLGNIAFAGLSFLGGGSGGAFGGGIYEVLPGSTLTETSSYVIANSPDNFDSGSA